MKRCVLLFTRVVAYVSMLIYPFWLRRLLVKFADLVRSWRFVIKTSCGARVSLRGPLYIQGHKYITHNLFYSGPGLRIECIDSYGKQKFTPELIIGDNVSFNFRCHVGCINRIVIGDNVLIGSNVLITDHSHGYNNSIDINTPAKDRDLYSKGPVVIEDNVWLGENVCVLPNVTIGRNSIIGANSVVTKDIPANCIAAGNPARVIRVVE